MKHRFPYSLLFSALCGLLFFCGTANGQTESPCKSNPVYKQQDFKLGVWDVQLANGKSVGTQTFEKMLDDCVIKETWAGTSGRQGSSFTYYNEASGYWHQTFVDNQGSSTVGYGKWAEDNKMTFTGRSSKGYYIRWSIYKVSENEMRAQNERSDDMGETWRPLGEIVYVRK